MKVAVKEETNVVRVITNPTAIMIFTPSQLCLARQMINIQKMPRPAAAAASAEAAAATAAMAAEEGPPEDRESILYWGVRKEASAASHPERCVLTGFVSEHSVIDGASQCAATLIPVLYSENFG